MPVRILIADDHQLMRRGLRTIIESHKGWQVCGEARTGNEAVQIAETLKPEVAILDVSMPELNGIDATRKIHRLSPKTEILILSVHCAHELIQEVIGAGARGFIAKNDSDQLLERAIETLLQHRPFLSTTATAAMVEQPRTADKDLRRDVELRSRLSQREREVVQLIAEGKSSKEVATHLGISTKTAETHRAKIMRKLEIHSSPELVRFAIRSLIIEA